MFFLLFLYIYRHGLYMYICIFRDTYLFPFFYTLFHFTFCNTKKKILKLFSAVLNGASVFDGAKIL